MTAVTEEAVRAALRKVKDPELALSVIDLGLVYGVTVHEGDVRVRMTLTSLGCPSGGEIVNAAQAAVEAVEGVTRSEIELVWSPPWSPDRIDPRVRAYLGID